jgi:Rieske 2Fe-2S family protein
VHPQLEKISPSDSGRNDLMDGPFLGGYSELREEGAGHVNNADRSRVYYYTIFPSLLLSLHPDYVMVHYMHPLAPDRTRIECAWLSRGNDVRDAVEFWDLTNRQDWHVNELTQAGVASRSYTPGPYANAEGLLAAFDRHYLKVMA